MPPSLLLFFGAGASRTLGIPTSRMFYDDFVQSKDFAELSDSDPFAAKFDEIVRLCGIDPFDVEAVMSILNALASNEKDKALTSGGRPTTLFLMNDDARKLAKDSKQEEAAHFRESLRKFIRDACESYDTTKLDTHYDGVFDPFLRSGVQWVAGLGASRRSVSIASTFQESTQRNLPKCWCFTTNYDCALEVYLQHRGLDIERGFKTRGNRAVLEIAEIHTDYEHKLMKLHGSVDMIRVEDEIELSTMFKPGSKTAAGKMVKGEVLIYPTQEKELFVFPFLDFYYEFLRALRAANLWVFVGFSFSDIPILSLINSEANQHKKILVVSPSATMHRDRELAAVTKVASVRPIDLEINSPELPDRIVGENTS